MSMVDHNSIPLNLSNGSTAPSLLRENLKIEMLIQSISPIYMLRKAHSNKGALQASRSFNQPNCFGEFSTGSYGSNRPALHLYLVIVSSYC